MVLRDITWGGERKDWPQRKRFLYKEPQRKRSTPASYATQPKDQTSDLRVYGWLVHTSGAAS
jgi:hypothetical protein